MIKPTVGRVMHYHAHPSENLSTIGADPLMCHVAGVVDDAHVNVSLFDSNGRYVDARLNVPIVQDDEPKPDGSFVAWMPFQKGQAAKNDDLTPRIAALEEQIKLLIEASGNTAKTL